MMKTPLLIAAFLCCAASITAQDIYAPILDMIARNCPELTVQQSQYEAAAAEAATGLAPDDPDVEGAYLWGGRETGNRKDISVSQSFDFPTVYAHRRQLSREQTRSASCLLNSSRTEVLLEAKELLIELVYVNALSAVYDSHAAQSKDIRQAYQRLYDAGEATQTDRNKAVMNETDVADRCTRLAMERDRIVTRLTYLNGGEPVTFSATQYPPVSLPADFEQWYDEAELRNPALAYLRSQAAVSRRSVSLAKAEGLPKLSAGYMGEFVLGSNFQGVKVGVSIPLWSNRHKVRHAKAAAVAAETAVANGRDELRADMLTLFNQVKSLDTVLKRYESDFANADNLTLLRKSLDLGQITLIQYLNETEYYFSLTEKMLQASRDRHLALARLYSFTL